jgi:hypothetical protein
MSKYEVKLYATIVVGVATALMILVRRYNNTDKNAGLGIGGWGIFTIFCIWGIGVD